MGEFIVGVVVDILSHIGVQNREGGSKSGISGSAWDFLVRDTAQFVVLYPEVRLQDLRCGGETKQGSISAREATAAIGIVFRQKRRTICEQSDTGGGDTCRG